MKTVLEDAIQHLSEAAKIEIPTDLLAIFDEEVYPEASTGTEENQLGSLQVEYLYLKMLYSI